MNVFEKYIANVHENENLSKVIDKLCYAYLVSTNDISERMRFKRFVKFVKWEFEEAYHPKEITLTYIEEDTRTVCQNLHKVEFCALLTSCFTESLLFSELFPVGSSAVVFSTSLDSGVLHPIILNPSSSIFNAAL